MSLFIKYGAMAGSAEKVFVQHGLITALSQARYSLAATSIVNYALFAGGSTESTYFDTVDSYNTSLVRQTSTSLSLKKHAMTSAAIGDYALFAGGIRYIAGSLEISSGVEAYNSSLVKSTPTGLQRARRLMGSTSTASYAILAGGMDFSGNWANAEIDAYSSTLVRKTSSLSTMRSNSSAVTIAGYALFAGGQKGGYQDYEKIKSIEIVTNSITLGTPLELTGARSSMGAALAGDYALFVGGQTSTGNTGIVDTFNSSLVRMTQTTVDVKGVYEGTTVENCAIFVGGGAVYFFNESLVRTKCFLEVNRAGGSITTIANYALYGGGRTGAATFIEKNQVSAFQVI